MQPQRLATPFLGLFVSPHSLSCVEMMTRSNGKAASPVDLPSKIRRHSFLEKLVDADASFEPLDAPAAGLENVGSFDALAAGLENVGSFDALAAGTLDFCGQISLVSAPNALLNASSDKMAVSILEEGEVDLSLPPPVHSLGHGQSTVSVDCQASGAGAVDRHVNVCADVPGLLPVESIAAGDCSVANCCAGSVGLMTAPGQSTIIVECPEILETA